MNNFKDELYLCFKDKKNTFIPFFKIKGSLISKKNEENCGGSMLLDEYISNINYQQLQENDYGKPTHNILPSELNDDNVIMTEEEKTDNTWHSNHKGGSKRSALPEDFYNYLNSRLNK